MRINIGYSKNGPTLFYKIKRAILINKPSTNLVCLGTKTSVGIYLRRRIYFFYKCHILKTNWIEQKTLKV
jgi:hypothetical protein